VKCALPPANKTRTRKLFDDNMTDRHLFNKREKTMTTASRHAQTVWSGNLTRGSGTVSSASEALRELPVSFKTRIGRPDGQTSPEELIAAAHSSCYAMALANLLTEEGHTPERLEVSAAVTLDDASGAPAITTSVLAASAQVPGIDGAALTELAERAGSVCPVSRALAGVNITVRAALTQQG
jgi:osmotically inducible protein OsmC